MVRYFTLSVFLFILGVPVVFSQSANWAVTKTQYDRAVCLLSDDYSGDFFVFYETEGPNSEEIALVVEKWDANRNVLWTRIFEEYYISSNNSNSWDVHFYDAFLADSAKTLVVWHSIGDADRSRVWFINSANGETLKEDYYTQRVYGMGVDPQGNIFYNVSKNVGFGNDEVRIETYSFNPRLPFQRTVRTKAVLPESDYEIWIDDSNVLAFAVGYYQTDPHTTFLINTSMPSVVALQQTNNFNLKQLHHYVIKDEFLDVDFNAGTLNYLRFFYDTINGVGRFGDEFGTYDFVNDTFIQLDSILLPEGTEVKHPYFRKLNRETREIERFSYRSSGEAIVEVLNFEGDLIRIDSFLNMFEIIFHDQLATANERIYAGSVNGEAYIASYGTTSAQPVNELIHELIVYPNPAKTTLTVVCEMTGDFGIYNATGQQIMQDEFNGRVEVDVSNFPKGIFFLKLISSETTITKEFVISR